MKPGTPTSVAGYRILLPVGTGGMGAVYLADREVVPGVERQYAVKLLHAHLGGEEAFAEQLLQEARLAAQIQHPNVVQVVEAGTDPHGVFLVMDYVEGATLAALVRQCSKRSELPPIDIVGRVLCDVLGGLHAAHELRDAEGRPLHVVHRDFSPQNIIVGSSGVSMLTDFGIAKALSRTSHTATGTVKGKVRYMAPEQAMGRAIDRRCDIWAAGVVTWEALTGRHLFDGETDAATIIAVVTGPDPPKVSTRRHEIPAAVDEAIAAALQREPSRRLPDAACLKRRLEAAWEQSVGLADHAAVARWVARLAGRKLEERRTQATEIRSLASRMGKVVHTAQRRAQASARDIMSASASGQTPSLLSPAVIGRDDANVPTGSGPISTDLGQELPMTALRRKILTGGAALMAASLMLWLLARPHEDPGGPAAVVPSSSAASFPDDALERTSQLASSSAAAAESAHAPVTLDVVADRPVAEVIVDGRTIALPEPAARFTLPLPGAGAAHPRQMTVIAADGRRRRVRLREGAARVEIHFPPRAAPKSARPSRPRDKHPLPDIVDNPYGVPP